MGTLEFEISWREKSPRSRRDEPLKASAGTAAALVVGVVIGAFSLRGPSIPLVQIADLPEFGALPVGAQSELHPVVIQNPGSGPLTLESIAVRTLENEASTEFVVDPGDCEQARIRAGGSCAIGISFQPQGLEWRQAKLVLVDDAPGSPQSFPLVGMGYLPPHPEAYVQPAELDFGLQKANSETELPLLISNRGNASLKLEEIAFDPEPGPFGVVPEPCADAEIAPNDECKITVTFSAQKPGPYSAVLAVHHGDTWPLSIPVRGVAEGPLEGYCCVKGKPLKSDEERCRAAGGFFSQNPDEMKLRCRVIEVGPTPPPPPPKDTPAVDSPQPPAPGREAPPSPIPIDPGASEAKTAPSLYPCDRVVLRWNPVDDPSQPVSYLVSLESATSERGPWNAFRGLPATQDTQLPLPQLLPSPTDLSRRVAATAGSTERFRRRAPSSPPTFFRWQVSTIDAAGNTSPPSELRYFHCQLVIQ